LNISSHIDELGESPEARAFQELTDRMRHASEVEPSAGLAARIMRGIDEQSGSGRERADSAVFRPWLGSAAAAAVILLVFVLRFLYPTAGSSYGRSLSNEQWLADSQEVDGSWNPDRHGGSRSYQPALTALSALALYRSGSQFMDQVERACRYLESIQQADGSFGGSGHEQLYNQAIVTYVLAETHLQEGSLNPVLQKAVAFIEADQSAEGGWDYVKNSPGSAAITSWEVLALFSAKGCGVTAADIPLRKGLLWLRGLTRPDGTVAYNTRSERTSDTITALAGHALITAGNDFPELSALGQRAVASMTQNQRGEGSDVYRDCMKVRALKAAGEVDHANILKNSMVLSAANGAADQWGGVLADVSISPPCSLWPAATE